MPRSLQEWDGYVWSQTVPTSIKDICAGRLTPQGLCAFFVWTSRSNRSSSSEDIIPSLAEVALLPYLAIKRGYLIDPFGATICSASSFNNAGADSIP